MQRLFSVSTSSDNREWIKNIAQSAEAQARPNNDYSVSDKDVIDAVLDYARGKPSEIIQFILETKAQKNNPDRPKKPIKYAGIL